MEYYPSHQMQHESYQEWPDYLGRFPWQWCVTLTFEPGINYFYALRLFKNWRMRLIDRERLRVAGYLLSAYKAGHIHCHALMLGTNKEGKTLCDCDSREWEAAWRFFARIQTVTNSPRVCKYVASHFLGFKSSHTEIEPFNGTLLRQVMRRQNDGFDNFDGILAP